MKYIKIKDEDYSNIKNILNDNNIEFEENNILDLYVENRIENMQNFELTNLKDIKEATRFVVNEINPLDIDLLINEALIIYESEV
jgi:hypothetical protein